MPSEESAEVVAYRRDDRIVARYEGDGTPRGVVEGTEAAMIKLAEELLAAADRGEKTKVQVWKQNKEGIFVDVPEGPPELWGPKEWTQFYDQFIGRRTQWYCQHCSTPPKSNLRKARSHIEKQHSSELLEKHVDTEDLDAF